MEIVHVKGGVGAGDVILHLNTAFSWSTYYEDSVRLYVHWEEPEEFWYVDGDPESIQQRYLHAHERMLESDRVSLEHVYGSDMFAFSEELKNNEDLRREANPPRILTESRDFVGTYVDMIYGGSAWAWKDEPTNEDIVVCWHQYANREAPHSYKNACFSARDWEQVIMEEMPMLFPNYRLKVFSYRDDFREVYDWVRRAKFCVGYDGMWHGIARNFGQVFVSVTGDMRLSQALTNPNAPIFHYPHQFYGYLNQLRDSSFLESEQAYMRRCNSLRMEYGGYTS